MSRSRLASTAQPQVTRFDPAPSFAGIARRLLAWLADAVMMSLIIVGGITAVDAIFGPAVRFQPEAAHLVDVIQVDRPVVALAAIVAAVLGAGYFVLPWVFAGGSPFQLLLGMRVVDAHGGGNLTVGRALVRWFMLFPPFATLSALLFDLPGSGLLIWGAALLWYPALLVTAYSSGRKQGLHDVASRAVVVRVDARAARSAVDVS